MSYPILMVCCMLVFIFSLYRFHVPFMIEYWSKPRTITADTRYDDTLWAFKAISENDQMMKMLCVTSHASCLQHLHKQYTDNEHFSLNHGECCIDHDLSQTVDNLVGVLTTDQ
eukprot:75133_1